MSQSGVQIDAQELVDTVAEFRLRGGNLKPAMAITAEMLVGRVNEEFDTEGHGFWPGLAPSTMRKRRGNIAKILQNTGRAAAATFSDSGDDFAEAATDVDYMKYHVSDKPRSKLPMRNPFDLWDMDDVVDETTEIILTHIAGAKT